MKKLLLLTLIAITATAHAGKSGDILDELDACLERRIEFLEHRQDGIDSLKALLPGHTTQADSSRIILEIATRYTGFENDSALAYYTQGIEHSDGIERLQFTWLRSALMPLAGFFKEAETDFLAIEPDSVPMRFKPSYFDSGRQLYSYLSVFFDSYPEYRTLYGNKAIDYQKKLLEQLSHDDIQYKFNLGEYYLLTGSDVKAKVLLQEVLDSPDDSGRFDARAAYHLSTIARNAGNENDYRYYLARSAINDVRTATREVASLQELGSVVHNSGDIARAHRYLSAAVENAVECGATLRMIESSKALPIIERAHNAHLAAGRRNMYIAIAALVLLSLVLAATLLLLRHEMKHMKALQNKLKTANNAKEVYISRFLELCSIYMDKLNQFCKISTRKIAAGQTDELYRMVRSGKFIEEQSNEFYEVFDNAFLHIYPDFVERVNALLRPDSRFSLSDNEKLNTDLRILAFMRLGIEESAKIAQVLNYSLNTIYAYRNRLKARAINRDTFEDDIMKIDSAG